MISSETTSVNCAEVRSSWGLFGSEAGYNGHQEGTSLNNFLVANGAEYYVVFLDEFDKTDSRVVETLLTICETGLYLCYRSDAFVLTCCSQEIIPEPATPKQQLLTSSLEVPRKPAKKRKTSTSPPGTPMQTPVRLRPRNGDGKVVKK
jgi:hypothetical protein